LDHLAVVEVCLDLDERNRYIGTKGNDRTQGVGTRSVNVFVGYLWGESAECVLIAGHVPLSELEQALPKDDSTRPPFSS
jgi:hypothetical protein